MLSVEIRRRAVFPAVVDMGSLLLPRDGCPFFFKSIAGVLRATVCRLLFGVLFVTSCVPSSAALA